MIAANIGVYVFAIAGIIRARLRSVTRVNTIQQAFAILEKALKSSYPDLPKGYTWNEVVTRLKSSNLRDQGLEWWDIEKTLREYEAFRYGGVAYSGNARISSVLKLAMSLPKRGGKIYVSGSQVQSN